MNNNNEIKLKSMKTIKSQSMGPEYLLEVNHRNYTSWIQDYYRYCTN